LRERVQFPRASVRLQGTLSPEAHVALGHFLFEWQIRVLNIEIHLYAEQEVEAQQLRTEFNNNNNSVLVY
jgi:hypothetical protein